MSNHPLSLSMLRSSSLLALMLALACGDDTTTMDAAVDANLPDGAQPDSGSDAGADAGADGGGDSGSDAGTLPGPWAWCPAASDYVGDAAWTDRLVVPDFLRCVMGDEGRTLEEDLVGKAQLWVAAGEYPFPPREAASGAMSLPFCVNTRDGEGPSPDGDGTFTVMVGDFVSQFDLTSPLDDGSMFSISTYLEREGDMPVPWPGGALDDSLTGGFGAPGMLNGQLMYGHRLGPCAGNSEWLEITAAATFGAGNIEFSYRAMPGSVSTGPSGGFRAQGTLDGTAFDVDDYFRIFYAAEHHHFGGQYAVFFDEPIRGACGLRLHAGTGERSLSLVDCDLVTLEVIDDAVLSGSFE